MRHRIFPIRLLSLILAFSFAVVPAALVVGKEATPIATPAAGVTVIASGLTSPRGFTCGEGGTLYLALVGAGGPGLVMAESVSGTPVPYMVGATSSVVAVADGCATPYSEGFFSALFGDDNWVWGVMDVALPDGQLYAMAGAGA